MKINIGIVGYGNLGKSVEQSLISSQNFNLVAIFSRRLIKSKFNTKIEFYDNFLEYKEKIDIMLLCGGSKSDLEFQTPEILQHFDCINTFDTHAKIESEYTKLNLLAKKYKHRLIMCAGWDPGIFSVIRALFYAISHTKPHTFWGKGISLGHSDAIRKVKNVEDAVQFTIPNEIALKKVKKGDYDDTLQKHLRECYVTCNILNQKQIEEDIKNIPNYFKGQPTSVHFVPHEKLLKLKSNLKHKGLVLTYFKTKNNTNCKMDFSISMESNPDFTASIMIAYATSVTRLKEQNQYGAYTCLDLPVSYLFEKTKYSKLLRDFC